MIIEINIPNIGQDELEITEIMIKVGDKINTNQSIITIEGEKTSMEIPSPHTGIITNIHVNIGDKIRTGSPILSLDTQNTNITPHNKEHDIKNDTDTTNYSIKSKNNIQIQKKTDDSIASIDSKSFNLTHATPLIRRMAREFKINLSKIKGSGRKGRILKEDIQNYLDKKHSNYKNNNNLFINTQGVLDSNISCSKTNFSKFGNVTTTELNKIQKKIGANLQRNWMIIPHITQFDEVDITDLETFRQQQNTEIKEKNLNFKITPLVFVMKAVSKALEEFPKFNSSLSQDKKTLILKKYINIGIAVDTTQGLLVPIIRDVNKKGIIKLAKELTEISKKARSNNQLTSSDMQGGSFTISSLGNIGGTMFTPIVNFPEIAILGISKTFIKPVWTGKEFIPRLILPLSLSYDHRVINGADGAKFITFINKVTSDIRLLSI